LHESFKHLSNVSSISTHCNTLQHNATHCNTLQHTATHYKTLQHSCTSLLNISQMSALQLFSIMYLVVAVWLFRKKVSKVRDFFSFLRDFFSFFWDFFFFFFSVWLLRITTCYHHSDQQPDWLWWNRFFGPVSVHAKERCKTWSRVEGESVVYVSGRGKRCVRVRAFVISMQMYERVRASRRTTT